MNTQEVPASVKRWPARKRCYACRSYFGEPELLVVQQLYCSYECAGLPVPDLSDKPRTCFNGKGKSYGKAKLVFFSMEEAAASPEARSDRSLHPYECPNCFLYHLGHEPQDVLVEQEWRRLEARLKMINHRSAIDVIMGRRPPFQGYPDWSHAWWMQPEYLQMG